MDVNTLDADFLAYRERGDVDALVRVFDAAAPRLLLLAAHLTARADEAEDLVQATFLAALRDARGFRGERPVLAWLAGILRHRALDLGRRKNVRAEHSLADVDEAHEPVAPQRSPIDLAADTEAFERVVAAIASLEAPYRELLTLRLVHGLDPAAIAHARGANPSTVRVQLKRGLERLRAALPDPSALLGVGVAALVAGEHSRGLAAVRDQLLAEARALPTLAASSPVAAPAVVAGAAWSTIGALAAFLAVVAGVVFFVQHDPPVAPALVTSSGVALVEPAEKVMATSARLLEEVGYLELEEVGYVELSENTDARAPAAPVAGAPFDADASTTVRGVLTRHDGTPVVGAVGKLHGWINVDGHSTGPDDVHVTTETDGSFAVDFDVLENHQYILEFELEGLVDPSWRWSSTPGRNSLPVGGELDLRTTILPRSCTVTVRVVDGAGVVSAQPFQIDVASTWRPNGTGARQCRWWLDTTSGEFVVPDVPYGDVRVSASSPLGHALTTSRFVDSETCVVDLVHAGPDETRRVHVDVREPVSMLHMQELPPASAFTLVDQQGQSHTAVISASDMFAFDFDGLDAETYTLHFSDSAYTPIAKPNVVPGQPVDVELTPSVAVELTVVSGATGEAVSGARVVAAIRTDTANAYFAQLGAAIPSIPTWHGSVELRSNAADVGAVRIVRTLPNPQVWEILADGYAPHTLDFTTGFTPGEVRAVSVVLVPPTSLAGRVVRANGTPVAGAKVHARRAQPLPPGTDVWEVKRDYLHRVQSVRRHEALTDENGRFEFEGLANAPYDVVVAVAPNVMAFAYDVLPTTEDFQFALPPAGALRGRLTADSAFDFTSCAVELERLAPVDEVRLAYLVPKFRSVLLNPNVQADGSFALDWIPAGSREVTIRLPQVVSDGGMGRTVTGGPVLERRTFEFVEGRDEWFEADISAHTATKARFAIELTGERDAGLLVVGYGLRSGGVSDDDELATSGLVTADGSVELVSVYPGTWDFFLHGSNGTWSVDIARGVVVAAGDVPQLAGSVTLARGRVEFVDADGQPFALGSVELPTFGRAGAESGSVGLDLDATGAIELVMPVGTHILRVSKATAYDSTRVLTDVVVEWTAEGPANARITVL
jgi:RNA polymerase sigma-70 factor (ECF subfamily)